MKQSTKQLLSLVAGSVLAIGAVTAVVGQGMGMGPGMGGHRGMMGMGSGRMGGMGPNMGGSMTATTERLAQTKSALGITAAQESAWKAYEQAVINQSALMNAHRQTMMSGGMPPAGDQRTAMHQQGSQMAHQTAQVKQDLYQVLSPAQRTKVGNLMGSHYGARRAM